MKEIILVRHSKSDWGHEFLKDTDRHLNERGYRDAYLLSEWYQKTKKLPDLIVSSTATRALSTALIFARTFNFNMQQFHLDQDIYEATAERILQVIGKQNSAVRSVMLFGHNPGLTNACNMLSDDLFFENIPTCGICSYGVDIQNWSELLPKTGTLNYYQFPKDYKNKD